jgi:ArsR family transcriptional regulator, cadmium/lead-responsive transcriptional repressor
VAAAQPATTAPGPRGEARVGAVFAALADPTRRHLVESLAAEPGATATGLAATLPISRQAVAKHLRLLEAARLVSSHRQGREALFELDPAPMAEAAAWMAAVGGEWDDRLGGLKGLLEGRADRSLRSPRR